MRTIVFIFVIFPSVLHAQQARNETRRGNREYKNEQYSEAELHYRRALEKDPESIRANYNLANALYKQEQYQPATTKYESITTSKAEKEDRARYYYNLGNSYFQTQKLTESIEAYKQSLRLNPGDADAKHNLFLAQQLLNQQKQQQQQQQNQQDQEQQNDQQNQQDQNQQKENQQQEQQQQQQRQSQSQQQQISQQDAERLLEALEQDEKETMKKIQEQKMNIKKIPVEKEW